MFIIRCIVKQEAVTRLLIFMPCMWPSFISMQRYCKLILDKMIRTWPGVGRGYSIMIWIGACRWDLKSRPIFIPNFVEKWNPFLYESLVNLKQILLKIFYIVFYIKLSSKFTKFFVSDWWNLAYFHTKFWTYESCLFQFLHWIMCHPYTRRLILGTISAARPLIDLCTKNPHPNPVKPGPLFCWSWLEQGLMSNSDSGRYVKVRLKFRRNASPDPPSFMMW